MSFLLTRNKKMSTRSMIGVYDKYNGCVTAIYCHCDGYISGVGHTLVQHYVDPLKIDELIDNGRISSLGETPHRQWNEEAKEYDSIDEYRTMADKSWCEYVYLYMDDVWQVCHIANGETQFRKFDLTTKDSWQC